MTETVFRFINHIRTKRRIENQTLQREFKTHGEDQRFNDFTVLIKNLEDKKDDFGVDKQIISEFISRVKPFRPRANSNAHSIIMISNEEDVLKYNIPIMTALLLKLWTNLKLL